MAYIYIDILSDILSGIYSDVLSGVFSGIHSCILSGIYYGILSGIYSDVLSGILSDIHLDTLSGILTDILFGMCSGPGVAHMHPELTIWLGVGSSDELTEEETRRRRRKEGVSPFLKARYPNLAGGELLERENSSIDTRYPTKVAGHAKITHC